MGECIYSGISVLRNNHSDLHVTRPGLVHYVEAAQLSIHELQVPKAPQAMGLFSRRTRGFTDISPAQHRIFIFHGSKSLCRIHRLITRTNCKRIWRKYTEVMKHRPVHTMTHPFSLYRILPFLHLLTFFVFLFYLDKCICCFLFLNVLLLLK